MSGKISQAQALTNVTGQESTLVAHNNANFKVPLSAIAALATKTTVGLANVDNTADAAKPVSTAQQTAINAAQTNAMAASAPVSHIGSGGAAHANATSSLAGFMSGADKVKLDGITGINTGDETTASILTKLNVTDLSGANTGDETGATILSKLGVTALSGTNTGDQTSVTGNAGTATVLQTARLINGVSFNGSADITINAVDATPRISAIEKGAANGVATLDAGGKVSAAQLPSYVDDVLEFADLAGFPVTGESGKIYVALDTNRPYRWSGSAYIFITSGAVDSVAGKTGVITLVKADVGLANVDDTADAAKPISAATQTALNGKAATVHTHVAADITDLATFVSTAATNVINNAEGVNFVTKEW
jgi:hypothetical protein